MSEPRPDLRKELKTAAISGAGGALLNSLLASTRFEVAGAEHYASTWGVGKPVVFVLWHGRLLPCTYYHRQQKLATLISQHRDGEYITRIVERWGFEVVRGSSSRGGAQALRQIVRTLRRGTAMAITPDGPRGPREVMKPGALIAAQMAGVPVIPVAAGTPRAWWFGGWDRFLVPKPFARIRMEYGEPFLIPREATEREIEEEFCPEVERRLGALMRRVDGGESGA